MTKKNSYSIFAFALFSLIIGALNAQVSGKIFKDYNANGIFESSTSYKEDGQSGVLVKAYDTNGNSLSVTYTGGGITTDNSGEYSVAGATLGQVRLEFILPDNYTFASNGLNGGSTIMFPTTNTQNLAVFYPNEYVGDANPYIAVPQYINGTYNNPGSSAFAGLYTFPYKNSGNVTGGLNLGQPDTVPTVKSLIGQIGANWGVAYQRNTKTLYSSAVLRRFCGFGPLGAGGIYKTDMTNPSNNSGSSNFIDVRTIGIETGADVRTSDPCNSLALAENAPAHDTAAANNVGKIGIGGIEYDEQRNTLWLVNLKDSKLYGIKNINPLTTPTAADVLGGYSISLPSGYNIVNGQLRAWGIKVYKGYIYIGAVADGSGESNPYDINNLRGYILKFDPNNPNNGFSVEYDFSFNFPRAGYGQYTGQWLCWQTAGFNLGSYWGDQPIISDIEFDSDGSIIAGVMSRGGLQNGSQNNNLTDCTDQLSELPTSGDILRICKTSGGYVLSGNSGCTTTIPSNVIVDADNDPAPPNSYIYEYYWGEHGPSPDNDAFNESAIGALAIIPGSNQVMTTSIDPENFHSGGVITLDNSTGRDVRRYNVYHTEGTGFTTATMAKAIGIGDIEVLANLPALEIGNRVWMDTDSDGEQDAGEMGLDGIKVELWKSGTKITETTTSNGGEWYFSNVEANTAYEIKILSSSFPSGKSITTANISSNAKDLIDNDAALVGSDAVISYTTGNAGENNHSLDFGFSVACNLSATATGTNVTCNGGTNGSANVTATGNIAPVIYLWSNGATTQSISNLTAGTYTVTVTETPTCSTTASYTVTESSALSVACAKTDVTTSGGNDGTASVTATGGTSPYTYLWSNGATTQSISNLTAGTYTVTVSDTNNCTSTCSTTVSEPGCNLSAIATGTNVTCNGGTNGSASVTASGNIAPVTYLWSNGATTQSISNLTAGTYTVTVTETPTCKTTASYTVTEPNTLNVACAKTDVTTSGGNDGTASVTATGGTSPYTYNWSNGATTSSISNLTAGTYTVTVSDTNNCTSTCSTTVSEPGCNLSAIATGTNVTCNGGTNGSASVTASGNIAPVTYLWSNGATTQSISNLTAGTYTVTITETPTCSTTASYTVTEPSILNIACSKTDVTTSGGNDGTASVTATGGTSPYTYNWSNGATTSSISNLTAGAYTVTVSDANNCIATCSTTVNEPGCALTATATGTNVTCNGGTNGSASVTATGNIAPITYLWSNGATTQSLSNLTAGTYTVTVTETPTCSTTASYTVSEPSALNVACAKTDVTTSGGNDGTTSVTATGGTSPYTYNWSNGATTQSISNLTAGTYTVTVSDANNCISTCSTTVNEPGCALTATTTGTNVTCNGGTNGSASVTATGNVAPVTYLWSNGATTQSISNLTAGTYTVTIIETATCITTAIYTVSEPSVLNVLCAKTDVTTSGGNDGTASVTASGGTSPYTYAWSNGATTQSISNLTAGTYTVTVSDTNNCIATCSTIVGSPAGCIKPNAGNDQTLTCVNNIVPTTASLGAAPTGTSWSIVNQPVTATAVVNTNTGEVTMMSATGRYIFALTNTSDAQCKDTVVITIKNCGDYSLCGTDEYVISADGGLLNYEWYQDSGSGFQLLSGQTASTLTVTTVGSYYWTAKDNNGCVISACDTVNFICILGTIGDYVWMDMDKDGIQDAGEPAVSGVILELYKSTDLTTVLQRDTTDSNGKYEFRGLVAGDYIVKAVSSSFPLGKVVSPKDVGNDSTDSDFDPMTHQSQVIPLDPMNASINPLLKDNPTIDLGLYAPFVCPPKVCTPVTVRKIK